MLRRRSSHSPPAALALLSALGLVLALGVAGCGKSAEKLEIQRGEVEEDLAVFLPLLAESYADGNVERLRGLAAEKELARITMRVTEYAEQGKVLVPEFHSVTVEKVNAWSPNSAFATTLEVWDLRLYSLGETRRLLSEVPGQSNRVTYQIKHDGERWRVLGRQIQEG